MQVPLAGVKLSMRPRASHLCVNHDRENVLYVYLFQRIRKTAGGVHIEKQTKTQLVYAILLPTTAMVWSLVVCRLFGRSSSANSRQVLTF